MSQISYKQLSLLVLAGLIFLIPLNSRADSTSKTAYLTFDADMTYSMVQKLKSGKVKKWYDPNLVSFLEQNKIPATIFATGLFVQTYPDLIRKLSSENFAIENHSFDHPGFAAPCYNLRIIKTDGEKILQVKKTQDIIQSLTGKPAKFFRFPGLCHSAHDDDLVRSLGLKLAPNDVISNDAFSNNAQEIVENVLSQVKNGSVILFHLGGPNAPKTFEALKIIVPKLEHRGYVFASL